MSSDRIHKGEYWSPAPEVWDAAKCARIARRRERDGLGTPGPHRGLVQFDSSPYGYGKRRYNGGWTRDGEWWEGTNIPLPKIPKEYCFVFRISWGIYLVLRTDAERDNERIIGE